MRVLKLSSAAVIVLLRFFASLPCASTPPSETEWKWECGVSGDFGEFEWFGIGKIMRAQFPSSERVVESVEKGLENRKLNEQIKSEQSANRNFFPRAPSRRPPRECSDEEIVDEIMTKVSPKLVVLRSNSEDTERSSKFKTIFRELVEEGVKRRKVKHGLFFGPNPFGKDKPCKKVYSLKDKERAIKDWLFPFKLGIELDDSFCRKLYDMFYPTYFSRREVLIHAKI